MAEVDAMRLSTCQQVAFTGTSAALTTAFGSQTYFIRLSANAPCHVKVGDGSPTATTADPYLPANWVDNFKVSPGQKVAAIKAATDGVITSANGTLSVTELTS